ncbi:MAG: hypothetical protein EOO09_00345 [Chitinophagaceae bacterium]|nr:MAG: hypothetical protein EOO09_00345 [Chitinophagaceae bacterium]
MTAKFTHEEIISYLSSTGQEQYHFLIDLEHPYFFTAGSRLTLFADNDRWAIVFEKAGFSTGSACGMLELSYYGNCLRNTTEPNGQTSNSKYVTLIEYDDLQAITEPDGFEQVAANAIEIRVRDKIVPIQNDPSEYRAKGIDPTGYSDRPDLIEFEAMIRFLDEVSRIHRPRVMDL